MADSDLRGLERSAKTSGDQVDVLRFRYACVRQGRPELAGFMVGDHVFVDEVESIWVRGNWEGELLRMFEGGDKYVRPINSEVLHYRVRPSPEYLAKGLYLTQQDDWQLVQPTVVFRPNEWYFPYTKINEKGREYVVYEVCKNFL